VSALIWRSMYDGQSGVVSYFFSMLGLIDNPSIILTTKLGAMFGLIFADIWKTTPFMALLLLAGLQTIEKELYEASIVDGCTRFQQFRHIVLPLLKPTILVAMLFRTLDTFRVFDLVFVLTSGGPANATESMSVYAYKTMFANIDFGRGSTLSIFIFICVAIISTLYIKVLGTDLFKKHE
jgi:multiple sugar transport system permease protein